MSVYHPGYDRKLRTMDYFLQIYLTFFFTFMRFYLLGNPKAEKFKNDRSISNRGKNINAVQYSFDEVRIFYTFYLIFYLISKLLELVIQFWHLLLQPF
jgi:hypothetical protein